VTRTQKYTIRVENRTGTAGSYLYKNDEVDVVIVNGTLTINPTSTQGYTIGDRITLSGVNTAGDYTFLFLTGPGLPGQGAQIQSLDPKNNSVINGVPATFAVVTPYGDHSWSWSWDTTGLKLLPGIYQVTAVDQARSATNLSNETWARTNVIIKNASFPADFIVLEPGWNFVSVPKKLASGKDSVQIFAPVNTDGHSIFLYNASTQSWHAMTLAEKVRPLDGIWIYAKSSSLVGLNLDTDPLQPPATKHLVAGWNAIGHSDTTAARASDTLGSIGDKWSTVIGYNAGAQHYDASIIYGAVDGTHGDFRLMYPEKGYWIYMTAPGELAAIGA
jgi:hypothetical protein